MWQVALVLKNTKKTSQTSSLKYFQIVVETFPIKSFSIFSVESKNGFNKWNKYYSNFKCCVVFSCALLCCALLCSPVLSCALLCIFPKFCYHELIYEFIDSIDLKKLYWTLINTSSNKKNGFNKWNIYYSNFKCCAVLCCVLLCSPVLSCALLCSPVLSFAFFLNLFIMNWSMNLLIQ